MVVSDLKPAAALAETLMELADLPLEFVLGGHPPELIDGADLVCLSGGVSADLPLAQQARPARYSPGERLAALPGGMPGDDDRHHRLSGQDHHH